METKATILIIDDDTSLRLGLTAILQRRGYTVIAARDGQDGLEKVRALKPDMILCDVMMPPPNGFEVRRLLSQDAALATIPFIFITARAGVDDRVSGIDEGADDYITKPFEPKELIARVEAVLRRVEVEQAKGRAQMKVVAENEMETFRHEILQNLHHELRTPLTNILLPLETILNHKFENPEDQTHFIRIALTNADRLEALTTDFILLTNIDHGDLNTTRQPIEVETQILAPIRRRLERYQAREIQLVTHIAMLGKLTAPRKEFTHIVTHLLDNAFKFSPQGGTVELSISSNEAGDTTLRVRDEGPGIAPEFAEKVFERFFQLSQGNTREYEGLGVGLTLAKAVMEKTGGRISILDVPKGCCVELYLPGQAPGEPAYG
jgi:signal transduction histidine kinase